MSDSDPQVAVTHELEAIPRGGLAQDLSRMVYEIVRHNGLRSWPQAQPGEDAACEISTLSVRHSVPDFSPAHAGRRCVVFGARSGPDTGG